MAFDSRWDIGAPSASTGPAALPSTCPACGSPLLTTTAKSPGVDTYWRCEKCGEVWNVSRRDSRPRRVHPWR